MSGLNTTKLYTCKGEDGNFHVYFTIIKNLNIYALSIIKYERVVDEMRASRTK